MKWLNIFRKKDKPRFSCRQIAELLLDYLKGEVDEATRRSMEHHLGLCKNCLSFLTSYKKTSDYLKGLAPREIPEEFSERLEEVLAERLRREGRA